MTDLFSRQAEKRAPLADRMRPRTLDEFLGQQHIVGEGRLLRRAILADRLTSSIFYGPPGTGKTTLAAIIAGTTHSAFAKLNAVTSGVGDVRKVIAEAEERLRFYGQATYLLLDECHRWSKSQSDSILSAIEKGIIYFIGSTTENPMIALTPALVSRCRLFAFHHLEKEDILRVLDAALTDIERGFGGKDIRVEPEALEHIALVAGGDARSALNALELAVLTTPPEKDGALRITREVAEESIQQRVLQCDESYFYDMLSAFCKSLRGSDSDAALAWFAKMLTAGVDPRIILRRVMVHASEDVGLAAPSALEQAVAAYRVLETVGLPEARLAMAQAIITLCEAPKSYSVAEAVERVFADPDLRRTDPVPPHLRDTHYAGAERTGAGKGYLFPHLFPGHYVAQEYAPPAQQGRQYYTPSDQGAENRIREIRKWRAELTEKEKPHD
jgi:putative ATPase